MDRGLNGEGVTLARAWKALRGRRALSVREVACVGAARTLLLADMVRDAAAPWVTLGASDDGDGAAAVWALLSIVRDGLLPDGFNYRIWPCTNPSGTALDRRSPETRGIVTANRDRTFTLTVGLCERPDAHVLCETASGSETLRIAAMQALEDGGFATRGLADGTTLCSRVLPTRSAQRSLAIATPLGARATDRIAMQRSAVTAALARLHKKGSS